MPETPDGALEELYREVILDHYKQPRNRGRLDGEGTTAADLLNPTCGDEIHLSLRLHGDAIADVRFEGRGCSISMASASMLTEACKGRTVAEAMTLFAEVKGMLTGRADGSALGDLQALAGVAQFPVRVKCASLGWNALAAALGRGEADREAGGPV